MFIAEASRTLYQHRSEERNQVEVYHSRSIPLLRTVPEGS
jgi:hypothetical protein